MQSQENTQEEVNPENSKSSYSYESIAIYAASIVAIGVVYSCCFSNQYSQDEIYLDDSLLVGFKKIYDNVVGKLADETD